MAEEKRILGMVVENKINMGDILTILGIFFFVVVISFGVWRELYDRTNHNETRIVVVEQEVINMKKQAEIDRADIKDDLNDIKNGIRNVQDQLNTKADKK